jgi:hypothetical protein
LVCFADSSAGSAADLCSKSEIGAFGSADVGYFEQLAGYNLPGHITAFIS